MTVVLVALAGAAGALARAAAGTRWPRWGVVAVNVAGSFVLGVIVERTAPGSAGRLVFGVGCCGALTTFSGFAAETWRRGAAYAVATVAGSVLGALAGLAVG